MLSTYELILLSMAQGSWSHWGLGIARSSSFVRGESPRYPERPRKILYSNLGAPQGAGEAEEGSSSKTPHSQTPVHKFGLVVIIKKSI